MTIAPAPQAELLQKPETDEQAAFLWDVGDEAQERALRYWVEEREMTYGQIVSMVKGYNPDSKISNRKLRYKAELMKAAGNPLKTKVPKNFQKPPSQKRLEAVENDVIDAEVSVVPAEEEVMARSIKDRLKSKPKTYQPNPNVRRHQPERHDQRSDGGSDRDDTLSRHWEDIQSSDEPDSYKQAQYFLSQFELQLQKGLRDGWSESAYETLWRDLSSYTKSCDSCSREYREQLDERVEEARSSIENPVPGSEDLLEASSS